MSKKAKPKEASLLPAPLRKSITDVLADLKALKITSAGDRLLVEDWLLRNKRAQTAIKGAYALEIEPLEKKLKPLKAELKASLKPLEEGELIVKQQLIDFDRLEKQRLLEEQQKLTAERDARELAKLRKSGLSKAEATAEVAALAPVIVTPPPRTPGTSVATNWQAIVEDLEAFVKWCLESWPERKAFILANDQLLRANAKASKGQVAPPPGIAYKDIGSYRASTR